MPATTPQDAAAALVTHVQSAAYMEGKAAGRQEAMRLVRSLQRRIQVEEMSPPAILHALAHLEDVLADLTREAERVTKTHATLLYEASRLLTPDPAPPRRY